MFSRIHRTRRAALAAAVTAIAVPLALAPAAHAEPFPAHEAESIDPPVLSLQARHGHVTKPPSRQQWCREGKVPNCGPVQYEPQSVEGKKGSLMCNGDNMFPELNDNELDWKRTDVKAGIVPFTWVLTAQHKTDRIEYFIGKGEHDRKLIRVFDYGAATPPKTFTHDVDLGDSTGYQQVLARWSVADTENAFYSCIDLNVLPA
jgi:predicted carbohydrate-binding protein with CBM5 and CBM33 domain